MIRTITAGLGAMGPVLSGGIADRGYVDEGYLLLAVILAVVILLTLQLPAPCRFSSRSGWGPATPTCDTRNDSPARRQDSF